MQIRIVVSIFVVLLLLSAALYGVNGTNGQEIGKKSAIVWMGLELTNENITVDLSSLSIHRSDLTGVSYEHYMVDSTGDMIALFPITNVTGKIQSFGLNTFPMIISANLNDIIFLLNHPSRFITEAIQQAQEFDYTGYNIDFEPTQSANDTVALEYSQFLTSFANALHSSGFELTVDIASWNTFWNFQYLNNTTVNILYDMDTYDSPAINYGIAFQNGISQISLGKIGIGLITVNVNNNSVLNSSSVGSRFKYLEYYNATNVAIWDMPLNGYWWTDLSQFLHGENTGKMIYDYVLASLLIVAVALVLSYYFTKRSKKK